jgi:hypothetical protein
MNAQTRKSPVLLFLLSLTLIVLFTSACSFLTPHLGSFSQVVEVTLDEQLFADSQPSFKIHDHNFWEDLDVDVTRMELHDGYLRFLGTRLMQDGSVADCTIDLSLGAEDGGLIARIIAVDIPGMQLTDPAVIEINHDLDATLSLSGFDRSAEVLFKEVEVTEDALRIKVQVNVRF